MKKQISPNDLIVDSIEDRARSAPQPGRIGSVALYASATIRAGRLADRLVEASDNDPTSDSRLGLAVRALNLADRLRTRTEARSVILGRDADWPQRYDMNGPQGRFRDIRALPDEYTPDSRDTWLHLNTERHNLEDQHRLEDYLLPKFKTRALDIYTRAIDAGLIPEDVRDRLKLIDTVSVSLLGSGAPAELLGSYRDTDVSLRLQSRDMLGTRRHGIKPVLYEKEMYETYIHEITHLLNGRLRNQAELAGRVLRPNLEVGIESRRAAFSTGWMNEALTEHIAQALVSGDINKLSGRIICESGNTYGYIDERAVLSHILELTRIPTQDMINAYFENGVGFRKSHESRQAEILMARIGDQFVPGTLGMVRRALDTNRGVERIKQILNDGFIDSGAAA